MIGFMRPFNITNKLVYDFEPAAIKTVTNWKLQPRTKQQLSITIFFLFGVQADTIPLFITCQFL